MTTISKKLKEPHAAATFATQFVDQYLDPAFGARSKVEIDLLVFGCLIQAGVIDPAAPLYDTARALNITPARVRTLLLNWQLRTIPATGDLREELVAALRQSRFAKDGTLMSFGIESPLLREDVSARLKRRGVFADASFSRELLRLPADAFVEFLDDLVDADTKAALYKLLVTDKQLPDRSFRALITGLITKLGEKAAGKAGEAIAGAAVSHVTDVVVAPALERVRAFLGHLLGGDAAGAANALVDEDLLDA